MKLRRVVALLAAPVLALGLAACGPEEPEPPATASQEEPADTDADTDPEETDAESPADEDTEEPSDEATSEDADESEEPDAGTTEIETLWIDDSWTVEQLDQDLCEMGGGSPAPYSEQEDLFVCGPNAVGAQACALEDGTVQCIVDPVGKQAVEFDTSTAPQEPQPREDSAIPLLVELPDGAVCTTLTHDHDQHWEGMFSWYRCDDGSELLTPDLIGDTFERGEPWTVQRSVDQGEPEETAVATAVFAGR